MGVIRGMLIDGRGKASKKVSCLQVKVDDIVGILVLSSEESLECLNYVS